MRIPALALLLFLFLGGCSSDDLVSADGELLVSPVRIDYPSTYVGHPTSRKVVIENRGRAARQLTLLVDEPFVPENTSLTLQGGEVREVSVRFAPAAPGPSEVILRVPEVPAEVALRGEALAVPECPPSTPCRTVRFDPSTGCEEILAPEGSSCGDACFVGTCNRGECVGEARSCDDGNACTLDSCDPASGCIHFDEASQCPDSDDPCRVPVCDPEVGCSFELAVEGSSCGPSDCSTSWVCLAGTCTEVQTPELGTCGEETPCRALGRCERGACVQPPATVLQPSWSHTAAPGTTLHFTGTTDAAGNTYWAECTFVSCDAISVTFAGQLRYRTTLFVEDVGRSPTGSLALAGDLLLSTLAPNRLEAFTPSSGERVWSTDLLAVVGGIENGWVDEAAAPVVTPDLVIVALEGFSRESEQVVRRGGWLVAVDRASGAPRWIHDAEGTFEGLVGDEGGNVYFSHRRHGAPPSEGGALVSVGVTGVERWRVETPHQAPVASLGGLLLQATGELRLTGDGSVRTALPSLLPTFPRRSPVATGSSLFVLGVPLEACDAGRCPVWIPHLFHYDLESGEPLWTLSLTDGQTSEPVVTAEQKVLFAHRLAGGGSSSPPRTVLVEYGTERRPVFTCELPAGGRYDGAAVLSAGQWVTVDTARRAVQSFGVQGRFAPRSGWINAGGDQDQSQRPR